MIGTRGDNVYSYIQSMINRSGTSMNNTINNNISNVHSNKANFSFTAPQSIFGRTVQSTSQGFARHYTRRN